MGQGGERRTIIRPQEWLKRYGSSRKITWYSFLSLHWRFGGLSAARNGGIGCWGVG